MSGSNCCFLTWIQISQEADQGDWYSHHLKNFPKVVGFYTVKGFGIVNKAEVDVFLEFSCFFYGPTDVGNLISGASTSSLNIWKFTFHILLKSVLENFEHYFANVWDECNCAVVWTFFVLFWTCIVLLWDWNENWSSAIYVSFFKTKIMTSGPNTSWQIDLEKVEAVTDFIFLGSTISLDGNCCNEIKTLAPWKKIYDKPRQCIKKAVISLC